MTRVVPSPLTLDERLAAWEGRLLRMKEAATVLRLDSVSLTGEDLAVLGRLIRDVRNERGS